MPGTSPERVRLAPQEFREAEEVHVLSTQFDGNPGVPFRPFRQGIHTCMKTARRAMR